jgi:hypothetical protein
LSFAPPIRLPFSEMIVVRVRLFSNLDMPTHYAVVGERALPGFQMLVPRGAIPERRFAPPPKPRSDPHHESVYRLFLR